MHCKTENNACCSCAEPPVIDAIQVNERKVSEGVIFARNGRTSTFSCVVSGTSPLNTYWELQKTRENITKVRSTFTSTLTQNDEGTYTCTVVNEQEGLSDNATVTVRVYGEQG